LPHLFVAEAFISVLESDVTLTATAIQFSGAMLGHPRAAKTLMREKEGGKSPEEERVVTRL